MSNIIAKNKNRKIKTSFQSSEKLARFDSFPQHIKILKIIYDKNLTFG